MTNRWGWNAQLVRYADDLVVLSNKPVEKVMECLREYLNRLELSINEEKSRITMAYEGFNFLGFAFRRRYSPMMGENYTCISNT
jgi:hypothetical protein